MPHPFRYFALAFPFATLLTGCTLQTTAPPAAVTVPAGVIRGTIMGGQQPVSGSTVYLVAMGEVGYGVPAATNIIATTTTDANGSFTLPAYTCPNAFDHTILEARGGNPGLAKGTNNSAIFLTAIPSGYCLGLSSSTYVVINEVTTVAAAYTLRPFINGNDVGTSAYNEQGLANAYATYVNLVNTATGTSPGANVPAGMSVPTATINALANSLAACVNTTGPSSSACVTLFGSTGVPVTGTTANTFNIAVSVASYPGEENPLPIYNVASSSPPFQPTLLSAPNDWTLPVVYTGGYLTSAETAMDIDTRGDVWVATDGGLNGTVEEVSPNGTLAATGLLNGTIDSPTSLAIDQNGNLVVGSSASSNPSVVSYSPPDAFQAGKIIFKATNALIQDPVSLAIDRSNDIIVAEYHANQALSLSSTNGSVLKDISSPLGSPLAVGVDNSGTIVIATSGSLGVYTTNFQSGGFTSTCNCDGYSIAFGASGVYMGDDEYTYYEAAPYTTASVVNDNLGLQTSMAVDGLGQIWAGLAYADDGVGFAIPPLTAGSAFEYEYAITTQSSFIPSAIAIDGSGNLWLADEGGGGLVELVGIAAPVTTPRAIAASKQVEGARP